MKCNYCGTTIPEGSKRCNGCGKKVTIFSNIQNSKTLNNNYKITENYTKPIQSREQQLEQLETLLEESEISVNDGAIQDKHASLATVLSIIGVMFIPIGFIFNLIALSEAKKIENQIQKEKTLRVVKILLVVSTMMTLLTLLPIIFAI